MSKYNRRIALRLSKLEREKIDELIRKRKFKNLSQAIRAAITKLLAELEVA